MDTFPDISRAPSVEPFGDEPSSEAVLIGDMASGYPLLNKLFTFDPRTFPVELRCVPQLEKEEIMTFYDEHKDKSFYWLNKQDGVTYEVVFAGRPGCRLDGRKDLWRITITFRQASP